MKTFFLFLPSILSYLILGAHFSRHGQVALVALCALFPFLLISKRDWIYKIYQLGLLFSILEWGRTIYTLAMLRIGVGMPWMRMALILSAVILLNLLSLWLLTKKKREAKRTAPAIASFFLTLVTLLFVHIKVSFPMIMLERFLPGFGLVEIVLIAFYAGFITEGFLTTNNRSKLRINIWIFFSLVFFSQLFLGLAGFTTFLQTGSLHFPIPSLIVGGPLYRGNHFFMLFLFLSTVALVGPSWCSHLCYIGALDQKMAELKARPARIPYLTNTLRYLLLPLIVIVALLFRYLNVSTMLIIWIVSLFGLVSLGVIFLLSRKSGQMVHCSRFCPIGILSTVLGRVNPFRIKIENSLCDDCNKCTLACRYNALSMEDVKKRTPNLACTLCGDCTQVCPTNAMGFRFLNAKPKFAMTLFYVLVVSFHAVFLAVARI